MAVKKATTTDDLTKVEGESPEAPKVEDGVSTAPTREQMVARVEEHTDPDMVAEVKKPGYTRVTSPQGFESTVPDSILGSLLESGYTK